MHSVQAYIAAQNAFAPVRRVLDRISFKKGDWREKFFAPEFVPLPQKRGGDFKKVW